MKIPRIPIEGSSYYRAYCRICREPIRVALTQIEESEKVEDFKGFVCDSCAHPSIHPGYNSIKTNVYGIVDGEWDNAVREYEDRLDEEKIN